MSHRFSLFSRKGGGACAALYVHVYAYGEILNTLFMDLDTPDQYQNIPIYL